MKPTSRNLLRRGFEGREASYCAKASKDKTKVERLRGQVIR